MTNEQLAVHIRQIHKRLEVALSEAEVAVKEDVPKEKLLEVRIVQPSSFYYPPMDGLHNLLSDLQDDIETLTKRP